VPMRALPKALTIDPASLHFLGGAIAVLLVLALGLLLPATGRQLLRQPSWFLASYLVARLLLQIVSPDTALGHALALASVVLLLAALGRSAVLLVLDIVLGRRLKRPLPRIVREIVQALVNLGVLLVALRTAGVELSSILTTSALLTAVIALSL